MKNVLFLINTLHTGGAERVLTDLLRKLPKDRYNITLCCLTGGRFQSELPGHITCKTLVPSLSPALTGFLTKVLSKLPGLTARLIGGHYDMEIAYLEGFPTKVIAARRGHAKKLAFVHTNAAQSDMISRQYPDQAACLAQYRLFDRVLFVSGDALQGFCTTFGSLENAQVIHNIIDFNRVRQQAQTPAPRNYTTKGLKLIAVGRLIPLKGFDRLIRICAELEKEFDFELFILGGGEQHSALQAILAETGAKNIHLAGMQENPYAWMQQADLLVCSSFAEGYSTTIVEALALGLPVITTDCAGMQEILEDGRWGRIVGLSDEALRQGLREILANPDAYNDLKHCAMTRAEQLTDEAAIAEYLQLFEDVSRQTKED